MAKPSDLVAYRDGKKTRYGLLVAAKHDLQDEWLVMAQGNRPNVLGRHPASVTICGAIIAGRQHLDHDQAQVRAEIAAMAESKPGKQAIQNARIRRASKVHLDPYTAGPDGPSGGPGALPAYQEPIRVSIAQGDGDPGELDTQAERYLYVRDPNAEPADLTADAREVRALDRLRRERPRQYEAWALARDRMSAQRIAERMDTSPGSVRVLKHRAREFLRAERAKEATA